MKAGLIVCATVALGYAVSAVPSQIPHAAPRAVFEKIKVTIDIKPGDEPTTMDPKSGGLVPVAILSTPDFTAAAVDTATVRFGAKGTEAAVMRAMAEDVNKDGRVDLLMLFRNSETGVACGHTSASLTGKTKDGTEIFGSEALRTEGC